MKRLLLATVVLLAAAPACTHDHALSGFRPLPARVLQSRSRVVAVVFDDRLVQPRYETSTDGHTFIFHGAQEMLTQAFDYALRGNVAAVRGVRGQPAANFDVHVIPELSIELSGMLNHHCKIRFAVTVANRQGQPVSRQEGTNDESFVGMGMAPQACETAIMGAFNDAAFKALPAIDSVR